MSKSRLWLPPDTAQFALWDERHPLFEKHGAETRLVETQYGSINVKIPARLGDAELANTIALTAAYFRGGFLNAHRLLPYAITESVAQTYLRRGGTIQGWLDYLADMGIIPDPRADNYFITYLRVLTGMDDPTSRLARWARYLDAWAHRWSPGPAFQGSNDSEDFGFPDPLLHGDDLPGSSGMTGWARHVGGIDKIAARHGAWLRERDCLRCGTHYEIAVTMRNCPQCQRPALDPEPHDGDIRIAADRHVFIEQAGDIIRDAEGEECHPEHPDAKQWWVRCRDNGEWMQKGLYASLADAEAVAQQERQNYSESLKTNKLPATVVTTVNGGNAVPFPGAPGDNPTENESAQPVVNGDAPVSEGGETALSTSTAVVPSGGGSSNEGETAPDEQSAGDDDDEEDENYRPTERDPPSGYESWEKARSDYEIYGRRFDWEEAPRPVKRWLSGDPDEYDESFKSLEKLGVESVGTLHDLFERHEGAAIADTLWALADDDAVLDALGDVVNHFVYQQYGIADIEELQKEHDISAAANRDLVKENQALKDEIAKLKGDKR